MRARLAFFLPLALVVSTALAFADSITVLQGNHAQPGMEMLQFNQPGLLDSGMEVQAATQSGFIVDFMGSDPLEAMGAGAARVASDYLMNLTSLMIKPNTVGDVLTDYIFNVRTMDNASGTLTITLDLTTGKPITEMFNIGSGENFFTIMSQGDGITGIKLSSSVGLLGIGQNLIDAPNALPATPEPASLFLFGSGMIGLVAWLRRSKKQL